MQLFGSKNWVTGKGRYAPEHWIGSHPQLSPCDLSVEENYWYWQDHAPPHSQDEFQFAMAPRRKFNTSNDFKSTETRENPDLRLREYTLLPGLLHRFITLYNETPPEDSWIWKWMPDSEFWKKGLVKYGNDVVDIVSSPGFDRNSTDLIQTKEEDVILHDKDAGTAFVSPYPYPKNSSILVPPRFARLPPGMDPKSPE
jgi:hypothetical protein